MSVFVTAPSLFLARGEVFHQTVKHNSLLSRLLLRASYRSNSVKLVSDWPHHTFLFRYLDKKTTEAFLHLTVSMPFSEALPQ